MTKILLVDDSMFSQQIAGNLLKANLEDVELIFAKDGQEGIESYLNHKPDYIITDLLMPKINGRDFIRLIKDHDTEAKIIVLTADVQKNIRDEIETMGVFMFLNKPFNQEKVTELCSKIRGGGND